MENKKINVNSFHLPRWEEFPDVDLYMDQVLTYIESTLYSYLHLEKNDKLLTKTMINNYVKQEILQPPKNKKYNKLHIAELFIICILKEIYSINDIQNLINFALNTSPADITYNNFCNTFEESLQNTFNGNAYLENIQFSDEQYILKNVVQSCVSKLYVQIVFLKKYEIS